MAKIIVNTTPSAITKIPSVASVPLETLAEVRIHAGGSTAKIGEPLAKKAPHTVYASDQNRYENADNKHIRISHMYSRQRNPARMRRPFDESSHHKHDNSGDA